MANVHWFRKGLRLHDNAAFNAAIEDGKLLIPIFILDPWFVKNAHVGPNRWRFLQQTLEDLNSSLVKIGSKLLVIRGTPEAVFEKIIKSWDVKKITWEIDIEPYSVKRDEIVEKIAKKYDVKVVANYGHTLYNPIKLLKNNFGKAPLTYQGLMKLIEKSGKPEISKKAVTSLPTTCQMVPNIAENTEYDVPSLKELNLSIENMFPCLYPGGETEALSRLDKSLANKSWVCKFEKPKTSPNSLEPATTVLSPYLKFGCLSSRLFYEKLIEIYRTSNHSQPPVSLLGQLYWREFYYLAGMNTENFDKMEGNQICKQIPWKKDDRLLKAWAEGKTGYPFIDAIMTQLIQEGWIHHLARHAVACFLTRGDLWQPWEEGLKVFEKYLLDADWALNAGNWMWLSASCFFYQYFRVYSPISFGKNTDKNGDYIRKYIPQLKKYPSQFIYEPWKAPLSVQKACNCIIGQDYPRPIVDHDVVRKANLAKMAAAYAANKDNGQNKRDGDPFTKSVKKKK